MSRLSRRFVEKPWGKDTLPAPFVAPAGERIGEVWFYPPPEMASILVKYIFTSEQLSVQVHPSDEQAAELHEADGGKDECWLVIDAEPGARLGIGFKQDVDIETIRRAALDGSIERLLAWHPVRAGDFFHLPAGTVHAIGAGVTLIEVQQNSDITYRLYDYGRPRELHLDKGLAVASGAPHDPALRRHLSLSETVELVRAKHFVCHFVQGTPPESVRMAYPGRCLVIPVSGALALGDGLLEEGDCAVVDTLDEVAFTASGAWIVVKAA